MPRSSRKAPGTSRERKEPAASSSSEQDSLKAYLREIAGLRPLPTEREKELGQRIREGDGAALNELVEANLRFVVAYAKRYRGLGVSLIDLVHEGNLGLIEAARRFDPDRNVRFISYAVWWIRQAILLALSEQRRAFRMPQRIVGRVARLQGVRDALRHELDREPTLAEVAQNAEMSEAEVGELDQINAGDVSLSTALDADGDLELEDVLEQEGVPGVETELIRTSMAAKLRDLVKSLDEKEREVIVMRFGLDGDDPRTLQDIGDRLGVTRERVRQIESRAKEKLRRMQPTQALRGCLN